MKGLIKKAIVVAGASAVFSKVFPKQAKEAKKTLQTVGLVIVDGISKIVGK